MLTHTKARIAHPTLPTNDSHHSTGWRARASATTSEQDPARYGTQAVSTTDPASQGAQSQRTQASAPWHFSYARTIQRSTPAATTLDGSLHLSLTHRQCCGANAGANSTAVCTERVSARAQGDRSRGRPRPERGRGVQAQ